MEKDKAKIQRAEQLLKDAYRVQRELPMSSQWHDKVMAHVRRIIIAPSVPDNVRSVAIVWRFAAAACICALVLLFYSFNTGIGPEYEAVRIFLDDPVGLVIPQSLTP